tara:strand:- start:94 stop:513 length:420 start_codon:yes stop_codon:yes gene_type:complete
MIVIIGSDHAGFTLKKKIIEYLETKYYKVIDVGCLDGERCDYPIYANKLCNSVINNQCIGILICGSGIGMSMAANRHNGIRCALCYNTYAAKMARSHTNANVLALGERVIGSDLAINIVEKFLTEPFLGGHYQIRLELF